MSVQLQANRQTPAQWALIGLGILAAGLFLAVPLAFIFIQAFQKGIAPVLENLVHPEMIHAVALTVFIALITVPVNMIFGVMLAWAVTRFSFPGKTVLLSCIDIPFAVSPVVAGLSICSGTVQMVLWRLGSMRHRSRSSLPGRAWCSSRFLSPVPLWPEN